MIKLLKHLTKREWRFAFCVLVLIIAQVWLDLKMPDYMNAITQIASGSSGIQGRVSGQMSNIWKNGGYMLLCALGSMACSIMTSWFVVNIAANYSARLRETLYTKVQRFSMTEINRFSTASLITRSTNDVQQVQMLLTMGLQMMIKAPITAAWGIVKISGKQWQWTAAVAAAVVALLAAIITIMLLVSPKFKVMQRLTDSLNRVTRENLTGIRVIRAFNAEGFQQQKFEQVNHEFTRTQLFAGRVMALLNPVMSMVMNGISLAIYWNGAAIINRANIMVHHGKLWD